MQMEQLLNWNICLFYGGFQPVWLLNIGSKKPRKEQQLFFLQLDVDISEDFSSFRLKRATQYIISASASHCALMQQAHCAITSKTN